MATTNYQLLLRIGIRLLLPVDMVPSSSMLRHLDFRMHQVPSNV